MTYNVIGSSNSDISAAAFDLVSMFDSVVHVRLVSKVGMTSLIYDDCDDIYIWRHTNLLHNHVVAWE